MTGKTELHELMLEIWWEIDPDSFNAYHRRYGGKGAEMLYRLRQSKSGYRFWQNTLIKLAYIEKGWKWKE